MHTGMPLDEHHGYELDLSSDDASSSDEHRLQAFGWHESVVLSGTMRSVAL